MQASRAGVVRLDCVLQLLLPPAGDVDLGAVGDQRLGDHEPDASAAARHNRGEMGAVEELARVELVVGALGCRWSLEAV